MNFALRPETYETMCARREIALVVTTEEPRNGIARVHHFKKGRNGHGREMSEGAVIDGIAGHFNALAPPIDRLAAAARTA